MTATATTPAPSSTPTAESVPRWARVLIVVLGVPNVVTGLWATVDPRSWFDAFPGFDPRLVAAEPPFNEHLARDAGAGLLAAGFVLVVVAVLGDRRSVLLGLAAFTTALLPHAAYHLATTPDLLSSSENIQGDAPLLVLLVVVAALFAMIWNRRTIGR